MILVKLLLPISILFSNFSNNLVIIPSLPFIFYLYFNIFYFNRSTSSLYLLSLFWCTEISELRLSTFILSRVFSRFNFCFIDPLRDYLMYYFVWLNVERILGCVELGSACEIISPWVFLECYGSCGGGLDSRGLLLGVVLIDFIS